MYSTAISCRELPKTRTTRDRIIATTKTIVYNADCSRRMI